MAVVTSSLRIRLSPTRKVLTPTAAMRVEIGVGCDAAFADDDTVRGHAGGEALGGLKRHFKGAQITIVDADQAAIEVQRAVEFGIVMDLDDGVHPMIFGSRGEVAGGRVVDLGHDDEDAIRAPKPGFGDLIGIEHEVLAQRRQAGCSASRGQILGRALERWRVGQNRKAGGAARLVGPGEVSAGRNLRGSALSTDLPS